MMTVSDLAAELSSVAENQWIVSSYPDQAGAVTWLPLVQISTTGIWLGLDRNGVWILGRLDGAVESSAKRLPSSWVTLLELSEESFRQDLQSAAERFELSSENLQKRIPVREVLTMAIRSRSAYWSERAVQWIQQRGASREHLELLQGVSTAEWANQRTRHIARRLAKSFED